MGNHEKPGVWSAVDWARTHKTVVLGAVAGVMALASALYPDFPGSVILGALTAILGG
jgi:hypothetical protein